MLVPTLFPFTIHWKAGAVPPFVMKAVKFTILPAQALPLPDTMIEGVTFGVTFMVITFEVSVLGVVQVLFEVR